MVEPQSFDEFFRASVGRLTGRMVVRLSYSATCGVHEGVELVPDPPEETTGDGWRSVRVACPTPGCGVSAVLTLRKVASPGQEESE